MSTFRVPWGGLPAPALFSSKSRGTTPLSCCRRSESRCTRRARAAFATLSRAAFATLSGLLGRCADWRLAWPVRSIPKPGFYVNYLGQVDDMYRRQSLFVRAQNLLPPQTSVRTFDTLRLKAHVQQGRLHLALRYHENAYRRKTIKRLMRTLVEAVHEIISVCAEESGRLGQQCQGAFGHSVP